MYTDVMSCSSRMSGSVEAMASRNSKWVLAVATFSLGWVSNHHFPIRRGLVLRSAVADKSGEGVFREPSSGFAVRLLKLLP